MVMVVLVARERTGTRGNRFLFAGQSIGFYVDLAIYFRVFRTFFKGDDDVGWRILQLQQHLLVVPADDGLVVDLDNLVAVLDFARDVGRRVDLDVSYTVFVWRRIYKQNC